MAPKVKTAVVRPQGTTTQQDYLPPAHAEKWLGDGDGTARECKHHCKYEAQFGGHYLGGDLSLLDEVCALRGFQEELAVRAPEDPRRLFWEGVAASSSSSGRPWAQVLSTVNERLTKQERVLASIQESLEHDRHRVNLTVLSAEIRFRVGL